MNIILQFLTKKHSNIVEEKAIVILFSFIPKMLIVLNVISIVIFSLFYQEIFYLSLSWYIASIILYMSYFFSYKRFLKKNFIQYASLFKKFRNDCILTGMLWSVLPIFFLPMLSQESQYILMMVLVSIAGGVSGFIFDIRISWILISSIMLPLFFTLLFSSFSNHLVLSLIILLFYLIIMTSSFHLNQIFFNSLSNQNLYKNSYKRLKIQTKRLSSLLHQAPIAIFYYDVDGKILKFNHLFFQLFSSQKNLQEFAHKKLKDLKALETMTIVFDKNSVKNNIKNSNHTYEFLFKQKKLWIQLKTSPLFNQHGEVVGGIGIIEDKTSQHLAHDKIRHLSLHDELTALPNRRNFRYFMKKLLKHQKHEEFYSLLFYLDLNHFKQINDTFGFIIADKLLAEVSLRLSSLIVDNKRHLSRLGGDEFILVHSFISTDKLKSNQEALKIAYALKNLFNEAFILDDISIHMRTSIAILLIEPMTYDIENMIRQADMAMYQTKREGQDNIYFYDKNLDSIRIEMVTLQHDLNQAIEDDELKLFYQPIVNIVDDKLVAMEALLRWEHPLRGIISPELFIPLATESGLIKKMSWWIIESACSQIAQWKDKNLLNFNYVAVNVNEKQLHELNFIQRLDLCIKKYNLNPSLLKLEITETTLIENFLKTQKIVEELKEIGVECNIDDFGTGYSSLSYLKQISFKTLKIDRIFITDILTNNEDEKLVKSMIEIAKQFHYDVVVEGVETIEQKNKLMNKDKNISYQGWLCSKAISADVFEKRFLGSKKEHN